MMESIADVYLMDGWMWREGGTYPYQPDEESMDGPNKRGAFQDDWQSNEDISALQGVAIDDNGKLEKAWVWRQAGTLIP